MQKTEKVTNKKHELILYAGMILTGLIFFFLLGEKGPVLYPDSETYLELQSAQGVMPVYPALLKLLLLLFHENGYLIALVIIQGILSFLCTFDFALFIKKQFSLQKVGTYVIFLLALLLYTIDFPGSVSSHAVLTEALAYPVFYLYMKFLLRFWLEGKWRDLGYNLLITLILSLIRSQLQLLWAVSAFFLFCFLTKSFFIQKEKRIKGYFYFPVLLAALVILMAGGVKLTGVFAGGMNQMMYGSEVKADHQSSYALWNRISYTMDAEDEALFSSPEDKKKFLLVYQALEQAGYRYEYRPHSLWSWEHVATVACRSEFVTAEALQPYYENMGFNETERKEAVSADIARMGMVLLKAHWNRYLYFSLILMIQGILCTVFIQKEAFYLLCHIVAFTLYLVAGIGAFICIKNRKCNTKAGSMMLIVLGTALLMNGITNLVFMGLQRYLYYVFGIFYVSLFLVGREIIYSLSGKKGEAENEAEK